MFLFIESRFFRIRGFNWIPTSWVFLSRGFLLWGLYWGLFLLICCVKLFVCDCLVWIYVEFDWPMLEMWDFKFDPKICFSKTMIQDSLTIGSPSNLNCRFVTQAYTFWLLWFCQITSLDRSLNETIALSTIPTREGNLLSKTTALSAIPTRGDNLFSEISAISAISTQGGKFT